MQTKRLLRKALTAVSLSATLLVVASPLTQTAHVLPVASGETTTRSLCYWDGKAYSAGAKKEFGGDIYTCQADGSWKKDGKSIPAMSVYRVYAP